MPNLLQKASIITTPTAYDNGLLNSVKPVSGENLIAYSEDFSQSAWNKSNTSIQINTTTSPSGNLDGSTLTDNATSSIHRLRDAVSLSASANYSLSVFAKKNTLSNIQLALINTANSNTISKVFDLENGVIGEELSQGGTTVSDAKIENYGNGWFRCIIVGQLNSSPNQYQITLATQSTGNSQSVKQVTYSGDGTGSIFLYGAQLERGSKASTYTPTNGTAIKNGSFDFTRGSSATRVNEQGLIEDVTDTNLPRIDYLGGTGHILLEPQSTNLQLRSQEFDNSVWNAQRATITANDAISPDGTLNAYKLTHTSGSSGYVFDTIPTVNSGDSRLISVFAKYIDDEVFKIVTFTDSGNAIFNLSNGTVTSVFGTITDAKIQNYGNGWYRCSCKYTATTTSTRNYGFYLDDISKQGVHIWGAQVEEQSFATSYIPTSGSTVTRSADVCNNSGSSDLINSTEGVLYAEIAALSNDGTFRMISISDGTNDNRVRINYSATSNQIAARVVDGGVTQVDFTHSLTDSTDFLKLAIYYKNNDCAFWVNGIKIGTDTTATMPSGLDTLNLNGGGGSPFYGKVKSVAVFKEALTDAELQCLTS